MLFVVIGINCPAKCDPNFVVKLTSLELATVPPPISPPPSLTPSPLPLSLTPSPQYLRYEEASWYRG